MMNALLETVRRLDAQVYSLLSRGHGNWFLDRLADLQESNTLLKGGLFVAAYCYFWFRVDERQQARREAIVVTVGAALLAILTARLMAAIAPYRVRPLYDAVQQGHPLSIPPPTSFVNWSSFPSDHAAYLSALGFGLVCLSRRLAIPVVLYVVGWICLPRMYLGIHYASDVVVGMAIGIAAVRLAVGSALLRARVSRPVLALSAQRPELFYPGAFLLLFEMTRLFWDMREPARAAFRSACVLCHTAVAQGVLAAAAVAAIGIVVARRLRGRVRRPVR
jgi:undecaprenyl-diphosphatase